MQRGRPRPPPHAKRFPSPHLRPLSIIHAVGRCPPAPLDSLTVVSPGPFYSVNTAQHAPSHPFNPLSLLSTYAPACLAPMVRRHPVSPEMLRGTRGALPPPPRAHSPRRYYRREKGTHPPTKVALIRRKPRLLTLWLTARIHTAARAHARPPEGEAPASLTAPVRAAAGA